MAWKQILTPNLDDNPKKPLYIYQGGKILTDWYCWCLAVTAGSFGAKCSAYSAKDAWNACGTKHQNYDLPEGVWVPVWWTGGQYGHVAEAKRTGNNIVVYSSPYTHKPYFQVFKGTVKSTLDSMAKTYGVSKFAGWSETLGSSRVVEYVKPNLKSDEEICAEIWAGKWGTGTDRKNRLTSAGYDYAKIQKMVDAGVGKPSEAKKEETTPQKTPEGEKGNEMDKDITKPVEPSENGSDEGTAQNGTDPSAPNSQLSPDSGSADNSQADSKTKTDETADAKDGFEPVIINADEIQDIHSVIEEASSVFNPSDKVKVVAYLVGDVLLVGGLLIPDIINTIQAPTMAIFGEYLSKVLIEAGVSILMVFKLIKKKGDK